MDQSRLNRRDFIKVLGTTGASLVIGIYLGGCDSASEPTAAIPTAGSTPAGATPQVEASPEVPPAGELVPNIYLKIASDGTVTVVAFRSEMGQGIRTAIAMLVAGALDAPWDAVRIVQADADPSYGDQVTGGSVSISSSYETVRRAGAAAREMLITAAAAQWGVEAAKCRTDAGFVVHPDGSQRLAYGDLVLPAAQLQPPNLYRVQVRAGASGNSISRDHWDAPAIITGKAIYGADIRLPGMLYAVIARCPVFGGRAASYDDSAALQVKGVRSVHAIDGQVAVVAENTWAAIKGRDALEINWDEGQKAALSSAGIRAQLAARAAAPGSAGGGEIDAVYEFPYQAHTTMEPMNCTAAVGENSCEIWAPTQNPQRVKSAVQSALNLPPKAVTVHVTLMGGGFGRRLQADYAVEAARVSQAAGAPVQVFWTRADDIRHDYYHPLSYQYVRGVPGSRKLPHIQALDGADFIPTGAWRSVFNHTGAFARECFLDELAHAAGVDPLEYRLAVFSGRERAVIELAAEKAGWGEAQPKNRGRGLACYSSFNVTPVAMVADVEVSPAGKVHVHRVVCAVDCGVVVNPDNIAKQMEGGVAFGLTAALKAGVTLENGRVTQSNFHDCPMLQIDEMPLVDVHIVESAAPPSGIGEMGVPPVAPAVANAVFDATGIRVRHLPIKPADLV